MSRSAARVSPALTLQDRADAFGVAGLFDEELVALALGVRTTERAEQILERVGSLSALVTADAATLESSGASRTAAARMGAAFELVRRATERVPQGEPITTAERVYRLLCVRLAALDHEQLAVVSLDGRRRPLGIDIVSVGGRGYLLIDPGRVFLVALRRGARAIIVAHNHPSGDPTPSAEDRSVTGRLVAAGRMLDIAVLAHVVVARGGYASLADLCERRTAPMELVAR